MVLSGDHIVVKRNVLNEIRSNNLTLQELRLFSIYLSRIDSRDPRTRKVRFLLEDFRNIMEFGSRISVDYMLRVTESLLCKIVNIPLDNTGAYTAFQLFKKCTVAHDKGGAWYVEIDAHDDALPLMFEFKRNFFSYKLWNALRLRSANQIRMYEILKQYEHVGERIIGVMDLRGLLGIGETEYPLYNTFKTHVLDVCQKALSEITDIKFTYGNWGKRGAGGKILTLRFVISKNEDYIDQLTLDAFLTPEELGYTYSIEPEILIVDGTPHDEAITLLGSACNGEFSREEIELLLNYVLEILPPDSGVNLEHFHWMKTCYDYLNVQATRQHIAHRFGYLRKIVEEKMKCSGGVQIGDFV
jgi:hypothetical protein